MTMKDVIIAFTWWTSPNMSPLIAKTLYIVKITDKNLVVDCCTQFFRPKEKYRVKIGDVNA